MDFRIFFASSTILWQCKTISLFKLVRPKLELEGGILGVENVWARDSQDHHNCGHLDFASEKGISYFQLLTEPVPLKNYFSANFSVSEDPFTARVFPQKNNFILLITMLSQRLRSK